MQKDGGPKVAPLQNPECSMRHSSVGPHLSVPVSLSELDTVISRIGK